MKEKIIELEPTVIHKNMGRDIGEHADVMDLTDGNHEKIEFITADELIKKYVVYANFYKMKQANGEMYDCRNVADIYDIEYKLSGKISKPQALIIMMNPGKCEPKNKYVIPTLTIDELNQISKKEPVVLCKPDNAQYQVMRIMEMKKWKHLRIVNLSDIKCSNGDEFKSLLKDLEDKYESDIHSIFSKERNDERNKLFSLEKDAPIILAWGTDRILVNLGAKCIKCIPSGNCKGIKYDKNLYYYPSAPLKTMKLDWLDKISKII